MEAENAGEAARPLVGATLAVRTTEGASQYMCVYLQLESQRQLAFGVASESRLR
jgi:hypothetical protein